MIDEQKSEEMLARAKLRMGRFGRLVEHADANGIATVSHGMMTEADQADFKAACAWTMDWLAATYGKGSP